MTEEEKKQTDGFLSAAQLLKTKGVDNVAWEDYKKSEFALPKTGKKYYEPSGTWLEKLQLENGLKNRKRLIEIERVERMSQLALAEWLPGSQRAKVTKQSGQKWDSFGFVEKSQLYLLPEEAMILLEMNCLELIWNGMPLSIQQAYEVLINSPSSKCTLDEYRVYSQLVRWGYKLQRFHYKSFESKSSSSTKRIIMNPDGLWTPNTSPTIDRQVSEDNGSSSGSNSNSKLENDGTDKTEKLDNDAPSKASKLGILREETVLGSIKIIKNNTVTNDAVTPTSQMSKWPGSRIQRNVKLMPKRNDITSNSSNNLSKNESNSTNNVTDVNFETINQNTVKVMPEKRKNKNIDEISAKKPRPEVIELSDDEIEEIPKPLTRMEILNTLPNLAGAGNEPFITQINRAYIPQSIKPVKEFYRHDRNKLLNLSHSDSSIRTKRQTSSVNNVNNGSSHFYEQRSQCQSITTYSSNNSYLYRGISCQRDGNSFIEQNISHNAIHSPFSGTVLQSNYINHFMEVMGTMFRSFRQQQFQQTTFCQNSPFFSSRFPYPQRFQQSLNFNYYSPPQNYYFRRGISGGGGYPASTHRGRAGGNRYGGNDHPRAPVQEELNQPSFSKRSGAKSWCELKKKWREESTITIDDEDPMQLDISDVEVVQESISPLINSKITNLAGVYEKLRIIKSAPEKTVRSRKVDYCLSYEVYPINQHYKKSCPGTPICRIFIINTKKEPCLDVSKLQKLQQDSKEVPVVVASVSLSCISYVQPGIVDLPNLS